MQRFQHLALRLGGAAIWLGILPFFLLCFYAHPSADDFLQANDVSKHGHVGYLKYMYLSWTGRYAAMLGWSFLNPVSFGQIGIAYKLGCLLMLVALLVGLVVLLRALVRGAGFTTGQLWQAGAGAFLLVVYHLPSTAEWFYWLTATYNNLLPCILLCFALALLASASHRTPATRRRYVAAAALLFFLTVGCNETIAVPLFLTAWAVVAVMFWEQKRVVGLGVALTITVGCALAFLAPGNAVRMAAERAVSPGLVAGAVKTLVFAAYSLVNWLGNGILVVVTLLLVPLFARLARQPALPLNQFVRHPLLLTLLVPAFLAAGLFPSFWVSGIPSPPRALSLLYLCFLLSWMLAAYAWVFYLVNRSGASPASLQLPGVVRWALLAWLPLTFVTDYNHHLRDPNHRLSTNNSFLAYRDLVHGAASRYNAELNARYQYLRTDPTPRPQVAALTAPPITLLFSDITPDTADWANTAYAEFFQKKTIVIAPDTARN
ncbi:MAG TPA: DUF6056 family protein [Hymenobacter sp.]|uniref:DUF6056 family protein n=1 Tax=Hymenobacter sp. TaxID=1898978 RepID=UPI002ED78F30